MASNTSRKKKTEAPAAEAQDASNSPEQLRMEHQRSVVLRLRRAEGQIRGVMRMIESGESCDNVAQQLAAVRNALDRAFFEMMACSLECEIVETTGVNSTHERVSELLRLISKYA